MKQLGSAIHLLWQLPVAVFSFCFYRTTRWLLYQLAKKKNKERYAKGDFFIWKELSEELQVPLVLPYTMVTGPRWNCHALMLIAGPFKVKSNIEIQVSAACKSAREWTGQVYAKDYCTHSYISSLTVDDHQGWQRVDLHTNHCVVCLRYFNVGNEIFCPAIRIDGVQRIDTQQLNSDQMQKYIEYLHSIRNLKNIFYFCLHFYVFFLLQWQLRLPAKFVKKEYLPVGNPETNFLFGSIKKGESIQVDFDEQLLDQANVYITLLNVCSFPVFWDTINGSGYIGPSMPGNGTYLIRIHHKKNQTTSENAFNRSDIRIKLCDTEA